MKTLRSLRKEEYGAGEWGTPELANTYKAATPKQTATEGLEKEHLDASRQAEIGKDHADLKTRSTTDLHKIHQGTLGKIHNKYTPADVGGKQGMISDILRHRHGDTHVARYFGLSEELKSTKVNESDKDEVSESSTDGVNLKITKHSELARQAAEIGDTRTQMWHLDRIKSLKA